MSTAKALFLAAASPTVVGVEVAGALALPPPPDELGTDVTALEGTRTAVTVYDRSHAAVGSKAGTKRAVATWLVRLFAKTLMT